MRHVAIVLAAGRGKRMNSAVAKQYLMLKDKPVLYYALKQFEDSFVDDIILVTGAEEISYCEKEIVKKFGFSKVRRVVAGGKERYHSVYQGLLAVKMLLTGLEEKPQRNDDFARDVCIYIHDGARPFVEEAMLLRAAESVERYGSGVIGMPVKDTIKIVDEESFAVSTPKRSYVWQVQTPQCFRYDIIMPAYQTLIDREQELLAQGITITDDAMVVELLGDVKVKMVEGSYENIKITTPEDLVVAESFLKGDF